MGYPKEFMIGYQVEVTGFKTKNRMLEMFTGDENGDIDKFISPMMGVFEVSATLIKGNVDKISKTDWSMGQYQVK